MTDSGTEPEPNLRRWLFGAVVLDERTRELTVSEEIVELDKKLEDVLLYLLKNSSRLVTKNELADACWPGRILSDSVLAKTISRLREALEDDDQSLIKTVHGKGYRLAASVRIEASKSAPSRKHRQTQEAERRHLTILYCELVGSNALSEKTDPEVLREAMSAYHSAAAAVAQRYEGTIAQITGDGLFVLFGFPVAHDDDAERGVRCGYDILRAIVRLKQPMPLAARIGIHTGSVVVGEMPGRSGQGVTMPMGLTTNLAVRIQSIAAPNTLLISKATMKLVPGLFVTKALDPVRVRDLDERISVFKILQPSGIRTRLEAADSLTPFVGRAEEISLLTNRWEAVEEGHGQACVITADPGMGKSRLLLTMREHTRKSAHSWLETRCLPLLRNSAYQPIVELLQNGLSIKESDDNAVKLERLEQAMDGVGFDKADAIPLLAPLLNLNIGDKYAPSPYGPEMRHKRTINLLNEWLLALAKQQPLILVVEDLHWSDPSTLELLNNLLEQLPGNPVLLLLTARPEFRPDWPHRNHVTPLILQPLRTKEAGQMLLCLTGDRPLPSAVQDKIQDRANGVPLFVEELTKSLLESGQLKESGGQLLMAGGLESLEIPSTLQDSLMARLDRLEDARELIQIVSVVGREIPYKLLTHVAGRNEDILQEQLGRLTDAGLLYMQGFPPSANYMIKHSLIQDTAYNSLLLAHRQKLHSRIADALEEHFQDRIQQEPVIIATHYEKAKRIEPAIVHLKMAAAAAEKRSSFAEALSHTEHALELAQLLQASAQRDRLELEFNMQIASYRSVTFGYGHQEGLKAVARALELCALVRDPQLLSITLFKLWVMHFSAGNQTAAWKDIEQLLEVARASNNKILEWWSVQIQGWTKIALGQLPGVMESLISTLAVWDEPTSVRLVGAYGYDPVAANKIALAQAQWLNGYPDRALKTAIEAVDVCKSRGLPLMVCWAEGLTLLPIRAWRREFTELLAGATQGEERASNLGFYSWWTTFRRYLSLAECGLGNTVQGLETSNAAIDAMKMSETTFRLPMHYCITAESLARGAKLQEAIAYLDAATELMERHEERLWEAELHRVKGELHLVGTAAGLSKQASHPSNAQKAQLPQDDGPAEASFLQALEISRRQGAKSLELRAATSLARLWKSQGRKAEARNLLGPIYEWFSEGFDTLDLIEAKALVQQLE